MFTKSYRFRDVSKQFIFCFNATSKILNLQKVDRDQLVNGLISKHLDGLNSQELRMNVIANINENSDYKTELLAPYLSDGTPMKIQNIVTYNVSVSSPSEGRPRFKVNSQSRTGKGYDHC